MNFDNIISMYVNTGTCPVIHLSNGLYVTCTSFQPGNNNESMLFYYQKNSNISIEVSGTYDHDTYTYDSNNGTWQDRSEEWR